MICFFPFECIVREEPRQLSPEYLVGQKVHYLMEKPEPFGQPNIYTWDLPRAGFLHFCTLDTLGLSCVFWDVYQQLQPSPVPPTAQQYQSPQS